MVAKEEELFVFSFLISDLLANPLPIAVFELLTELVVDLKAIIGEIGGGTCLPTNKKNGAVNIHVLFFSFTL